MRLRKIHADREYTVAMRLFVALDIPEPIRREINTYVDDLRRVAPDTKWVRADNYHITLKFIGEWKRDVCEVIEAVSKVEGPAIDVAIRGNGFFPTPRSPRVFWVGIESKPWGKNTLEGEDGPSECGDGLPSPSGFESALQVLAAQVDQATSTLGIEPESRPFSPHLTLARSGSGSPRPRNDEKAVPSMKRLADRIAAMPAPDFGTIHATEFYLYESKLSSGGAKYTKLKSFGLRR